MKKASYPGLTALALLAVSISAAEYISADIKAKAGVTTPIGEDGFDIQGAGGDIWLEKDSFRFLYQKIDGDFDIRARVASMQDTHEWAKAGVMVRQTTETGSVHAMMCITSQRGFTFQRRTGADGSSIGSQTPNTTLPFADIPGQKWVRLKRSGRAITAYKATDEDGAAWQEVGKETLNLTNPALVGLFVCSHDASKLCLVEFRKVSLEAVWPDVGTKPNGAPPASAEKKTPAAPPPPKASGPAEYKPMDKTLAAGLAAGAAKLIVEGKTDKARDMLFQALANDEQCAEALYELGKLYEKEGSNVAAVNFLVRATQELGKSEAANPAFVAKRQDAERRVLKLNPYATRYANMLADYTVDLNTITKKVTDALTLEEACDRADTLKLRETLPPEKRPKFERAVAAKTAPKTQPRTSVDGETITPQRTYAPTSVPPDVERALKAAGWTTILGAWKKKAENVYEVTDGKLETQKINGAIQVTVHKGGTGNVRAMVRNGHTDYYYSSYSSYSTGYGVRIEGQSCKMFTPYNYSGLNYRPYMEREVNLPDPNKNTILITVIDGNLEYISNGSKREHKSNYKINQSGAFVIEVEGTMIIESPGAKGQ